MRQYNDGSVEVKDARDADEKLLSVLTTCSCGRGAVQRVRERQGGAGTDGPGRRRRRRGDGSEAVVSAG